VSRLETTVREAIFDFLTSKSEQLRLAAIAAASDLSPAGKALVSWAIAARAADLVEPPLVRAAAEAFLRTHRVARRAASY
jgi:hypothetical protein